MTGPCVYVRVFVFVCAQTKELLHGSELDGLPGSCARAASVLFVSPQAAVTLGRVVLLLRDCAHMSKAVFELCAPALDPAQPRGVAAISAARALRNNSACGEARHLLMMVCGSTERLLLEQLPVPQLQPACVWQSAVMTAGEQRAALGHIATIVQHYSTARLLIRQLQPRATEGTNGDNVEEDEAEHARAVLATSAALCMCDALMRRSLTEADADTGDAAELCEEHLDSVEQIQQARLGAAAAWMRAHPEVRVFCGHLDGTDLCDTTAGFALPSGLARTRSALLSYLHPASSLPRQAWGSLRDNRLFRCSRLGAVYTACDATMAFLRAVAGGGEEAWTQWQEDSEQACRDAAADSLAGNGNTEQVKAAAQERRSQHLRRGAALLAGDWSTHPEVRILRDVAIAVQWTHLPLFPPTPQHALRWQEDSAGVASFDVAACGVPRWTHMTKIGRNGENAEVAVSLFNQALGSDFSRRSLSLGSRALPSRYLPHAGLRLTEAQVCV